VCPCDRPFGPSRGCSSSSTTHTRHHQQQPPCHDAYASSPPPTTIPGRHVATVNDHLRHVTTVDDHLCHITTVDNAHTPRHSQRQPHTPSHHRRQRPHATSQPLTPPSHHVSIDKSRATSQRLPLPSSRDVGAEINGWEVRRSEGARRLGKGERGGRENGTSEKRSITYLPPGIQSLCAKIRV